MTTDLLKVTVLLPGPDTDRSQLLTGLAGQAVNVLATDAGLVTWWTTDCQGEHACRDWLKCVSAACHPERVWVSWNRVTGGWYSEV